LWPSEIQGKRILYTVLNWGLGHASRSVPLIKVLLNQGNDLHICSDGLAFELLKAELSSSQLYELPSLRIHYNKQSMVSNMLSQLPHLMNHYRADIKAIQTLEKKIKPDIIIADHRYGTRHKNCHSIFLGHQLSILNPDFTNQGLASTINAKLINRFDEIWVPDIADQTFSGRLSSNEKIKRPIHFIGPLSRFNRVPNTNKQYDILAVLSGPEPNRTNLEARIFEQMKELDGRFAIVSGIPDSKITSTSRIEVFGLQVKSDLQALCNRSKRFVGRAGYSTIMDMCALGLPSLLMPTPGQTEQLYLSHHIHDHQFQFCTEAKLDLESFMNSLVHSSRT